MANPQIIVEYVARTASLDAATSKLGATGNKIAGGVRKAFLPAVGALTALGIAAHKAIDDASNLSEQINKARQVFGKSAPAIVAWSQTTAKALGISQRAALEAAGTFGNMLVPMGIGRGKAAAMSKTMVKLAADMASFNNASPEDTLQALRSGLAGETEPLRKFGVFLSQARIQQQALASGIVKSAAAQKAAASAVSAAQHDVTAATSARARAEREITSASAKIVSTEQAVTSAARALTAAQERVRDSTERLNDARDRQQAAIQRTKDAQENLRTAQVRATTAQLALVEARRKATQQLQDLKAAAIDAGLTEERATLSLDQARERLAKVAADSSATELDRRDAILSVKEAERSVAEAAAKRIKTVDDLATAEKAGVDGSKEVLAARQEIIKADRQAEKAAIALRTAQRAQLDALDSVKDSLRGVAAAQTSLRDAQAGSRAAVLKHQQAQQSLATAQHHSVQAAHALSAAQADLTKAQKEAAKVAGRNENNMTAAQKAMATYKIIMGDTKDTQGDFARTSKGLANQQRIQAAASEDLSAKMGKDLIPTMQQFNDLSLKMMGFLSENPRLLQVFAAAIAVVSAAVIVLNIALAITAALTSPITLIILGVVAGLVLLAAGFVLAYKKIDLFRQIVDATWGFIKRNWPLLLAVLLGPIAVAAVLIIRNWDKISDAAKAAVDTIKRVFSTVKGAILGALVGIGTAAWSVIDNIGGTVLRQANTILGWGTTLGTTIKNGVVNGITGIALAAWGVIDNIGQFITENISTIIGWGKAIGEGIKAGLVAGIGGVKDALVGAFRTAINAVIHLWNKLKIPGFKIKGPGPLPDINFPAVKFPDITPLAKGGIVTRPTMALLGEAGPEAVIPLAGGTGAVEVRVFIGETELKGMVRAEVRTENTRTAQVLLAGAG